MSAEFWAIIGVGAFLGMLMVSCTKDIRAKLDTLIDIIFHERRYPRD